MDNHILIVPFSSDADPAQLLECGIEAQQGLIDSIESYGDEIESDENQTWVVHFRPSYSMIIINSRAELKKNVPDEMKAVAEMIKAKKITCDQLLSLYNGVSRFDPQF